MSYQSFRRCLTTTALTPLLGVIALSSIAYANPQDGVVVGGAADIVNGVNRVDINQSSQRAVIDWRSFNIDANETTAFHQPSSSSLTVNRVNDGNPSSILGHLSANGNIVLINPSGIAFGAGSVVDVNGLVATTSNISNSDAMNGNLSFHGTGGSGSVVNNGTITAADAGLVGLVAPSVQNNGVINARLGKVQLAAGDTYTLDLYGDGLMNVTASDAVTQEVVKNSGVVNAAGGVIAMTAAAGAHVVNSLVDISGELKTASVTQQGGKIIISGDAISNIGTLDASGTIGGTITVSGRNIAEQGHLNANGSNGSGGTITTNFTGSYLDNQQSTTTATGQHGNGGAVSVLGANGSHAFISGTYDVSSNSVNGGTINITADQGDLKLFGAHAKADGYNNGGQIHVGGNYQGTGTLAHAKTTGINFATTLSANGITQGSGGEITVWSDNLTQFAGHASAKSFAKKGHGGLIELSSKDTLQVTKNADIDASALTKSNAGQLLLDPKNIIIATGGISGGISSFEFVDPNSDAGTFGFSVNVLPSGNVIISDPQDDLIATDAGAIYMFNGSTGGLISTLTGGSAGDQIGEFLLYGSSDIRVLATGNAFVRSVNWDNGATADAGAYTLINQNTGLSGIVSAANSLVGTHTNDLDSSEVDNLSIGSNYTSTGNLLLRNPFWDNGGVVDAGAVIMFNGTTGVTGNIDSSTALVGSSANDIVGGTNYGAVDFLPDGSAIIRDTQWDNGAAADAGAIIWINGVTGKTGVVSAANALVGTQTDDFVGSGWLNMLTNGNYVITSEWWANGAAANAGAATFFLANTDKTGIVSAANSLVGTKPGDRVGLDGAVALSNGNYVVASTFWGNGTYGYVGAATWGDGTTGVTGTVSAANSIVGSYTLDQIRPILATTTGDYLVGSDEWSGGGLSNLGAVTWASGTGPTSRIVSAANSIVGTTAGDQIALLRALPNGNYLVGSPTWDNGATVDAGAVRMGLANGSSIGAINGANALVGTHTNDKISSNYAQVLANGNYLILSSEWNNGAGAATWGSQNAPLIGAVSSSNSLVGGTSGDYVGDNYLYELANGNYIITVPHWQNGGAADAGAVVWGDGTTGVTGVVSAATALVGSTASDNVGSQYIRELATGNFLITAPDWDNGAAVDAGALVFASGTSPTTGVVGASNSLIGSHSGDRVGDNVLGDYYFMTSTGNYLVLTPNWDNGTLADAGAITWGSGTTGVVGTINASNSVIGSSAGDQLGSNGLQFTNENFVVLSPFYDNGSTADVGAITWVNNLTGLTGFINDTNSMLGTTANDQVGDGTVEEIGANKYAIISQVWDNGADVDTGAVTLLDMSTSTSGYVSAANSFVGPTGNGGAYGVADTTNNRYIVDYYNDQRVFSISASGGSLGSYDSYTDLPSSSVTLDPAFITAVLNAGTNVTLQANNDITLTDDLIVNNGGGSGGTLTFQAGRSILLNADITTDDGDLNIFANEDLATGVVNANRDAGSAVITMGAGAEIDAGAGNVHIRLDDGTGKTNHSAGDITLRDITADSILVENKNTTGDVILQSGALTASGTGDAITLASMRNFVNNVGASALSATSGRWLVYSTNPADDIIGSLPYDDQIYACTYNGVCPTISTTDNLLLYTYDPSAPTPPAIPPAAIVPPTVLYVSQTPNVGNLTALAISPSLNSLGRISPSQSDNELSFYDMASVNSLYKDSWYVIDPLLAQILNFTR